MNLEHIDTSNKKCQNCGHHVRDFYCGHCGKKYQEGRFTFKSIFQNWLSERKTDISIFLLTTRDLLLRPGEVVGGYWEGKTEVYYQPFNYFLVIASLVVFVTLTNNNFDPEKALALNNKFKQTFEQQNANQAESLTPEEREKQQKIIDKQVQFILWTRKNFNLALLVAIPFFAFGVYLLFKKRDINYGEQLIYAFYTHGFMGLVFLPTYYFIDPFDNANPLKLAYIPFSIGYYAWGFINLYKINWLTALWKSILTQILYIVFFLGGVLVITFVCVMIFVGIVILQKQLGLDIISI